MGSRVTLFLDDAELEQADVDGSGKFAVFVFLDPSERPRLLTLRAALDGQEVWSEDQIILAPTPVVQPEEEVAEAAPTPSEEEQVAAVETVDRDALQALAGRIFATEPTLAAIGPLSRLESYERIADRLRVS